MSTIAVVGVIAWTIAMLGIGALLGVQIGRVSAFREAREHFERIFGGDR